MNAADLDLPPHSIEAEQAVLGALLLDNKAWPRVRDVLTEGDFYRADHRTIWRALDGLLREDGAADVLTVTDSLRGTGELEDAGGLVYLHQLATATPSAANITSYAAIVARVARQRELAGHFEELRLAALAPGADVDMLLQDAAVRLSSAGPVIPTPSRWTLPEPIGAEEFAAASLSPRCIVEDLLYADVAVLVAAGGTGKTTLTIFEAVHIVLGLPLYGLTVRAPGPVLILSAEDSREMLVARLRCIADGLGLSAEQTAIVRRDVRISDLSGTAFKLTTIVNDMILPTPVLDQLIAEARALAPALVVIDPAVSFGVGETRVNDAEQALIEAARRIRRLLACCVRLIHHSGKQNSRDKVVDQYAGRGGSTMADGARMVAVARPLTAQEWQEAASTTLLEDEMGILLARPKLSYRPPQPDILILRKGYHFTHVLRTSRTKSEDLELNAAQVLRCLETDSAAGTRHTQNSLEALDLGMSRRAVRDAVQTLLARGKIEKAQADPPPIHGSRIYLRPVAAPTAAGQNGAPNAK